MAEIDVGLRILLQDLASGGLTSFKGVLQDLVQFASAGGLGFRDFSGAIQQLEGSITAGEAKLAQYNNEMGLLQLKNEAATASLAATKIEMEAIGNLPTQRQINGLTKEIDAWQTELTAANKELANWEEGLALSGGQSEYSAEKVGLYRAEVENLTTKIEDAKAQIQLLNDQGLLQNEAALKRSEAASLGAQQNMDKLTASVDAQALSLEANKAKLEDMTAAQEAATAAQQQMLLGVGLLAGGTLGLGLLGSAMGTAVKDASSLEDAMAGLKIAFGLTDEQSNEMSRTLQTVASNSRFSVIQVAEAFTLLGEYGRSASDVINHGIGQAAINMAEAMNTDATPAAELLSSTMTTFGASADEAAKYSDMLTYAFYHGIPSVSELQTAIQDVGGVAAEMKIPFDQLVSVLDFLSQSGIQAGTASNSLRYMLTNLQDPTSKASKEMADLGIVTINNTSPAFEKFAAELKAAADAAGQTAQPFDGTLTSLQKMFTQSQGLHTEITATDKSFYSWATSLGITSSSLVDSQGHVKDLFSILSQLGDSLKGLPDNQKLQRIQDIFNVRSSQDARKLLDDIDAVLAHLDKTDKGVKDYSKDGGAAKDAKTRTGTESATKQKADTTITGLLAQVGTPLLGWLKQAYEGINHLASGIDGANPKVQQAVGIFAAIIGVLSILAVIAGIVAIAMIPVVTPFVLFGLAVVGIILGVGLLAAGIAVLAVKFKDWLASGSPLADFLRNLGHLFSTAFGASIKDIIGGFSSTWDKLEKGMGGMKGPTADIVSAFSQLRQAMQPVLPVIVAILGGIGVLVAGVLVGVLRGAVVAITVAIHGLATIIAGVALIFAGIINVVVGAFRLIGALFSRDPKAWSQATDQWTKGFQQIFQGVWHVVSGIFQAGIGSIIGFIQGFATGIIKWFQHVADVLYVHSIVPDMWKAILKLFTTFPQMILSAIISWVASLISHFISMGVLGLAAAVSLWNMVRNAFSGGVSAVVGLVTSLPGKIVSLLSGLGGSMLNSASNAMHMFAQGILNGIGAVQNAVGSAADTVKHFLGFNSPPKGGPLADSDKYMGNMMRMFGQGIISNQHHVTGAVNTVATMMHKGFQTPLTQAAGGAFSSSAGGSGNTVLQVTLDSKVLGEAAINHATGQMRMTGMNRRMR